MTDNSREMWDSGGSKPADNDDDSNQRRDDGKFKQMQEYIPFLETMIAKLERTQDNSREAQLTKLKSLHHVLSNSKKKMKIETLMKFEEILKKLRDKLDKVPDFNAGNKQESSVTGDLSKLSIVADKSEAVVSSTTSQAPVYVMPLKKAVARVKEDSPSRVASVPTVSSSQSDNCVSSTETRLPEDILAQSREKLTKIVDIPDIPNESPPDMEWMYDRRKDVLSGKEKALRNSPAPKFRTYDIAASRDWGCDSNRQLVNRNPPLSESLSITYNITNYVDRTANSIPEHHKQLWSSHSDNSIGKPIVSSEVLEDQTKGFVSNTKLPNAFPVQSVSNEDDTTPLRKEDGTSARSLRAKLEEEIHKVHRVGVSTGGALRGLINKEDRKNSPVKSKTDKSNTDSVSPIHSLLDREKINVRAKLTDQKTDEKMPLFSRSPRKQSTNEQPTLANRSDSESLKSLEPKTGESCDPRLKQGSSYSARNPQSSHQQSHNDSQGKAQGLLSSLTPEDLQRIVTENLQRLPSPPPNTKEILENVKASSPLTATWDKSQNSAPYSSNFRSPNVSFNQKQQQGSGSYGYENVAEQPSANNRTVLLPTPPVPPQYAGNHSQQNIMYGSSRHRDSEAHKGSQYGHQGNVIDPRLNIHRSPAVDHRGNKDPRLNSADYSQSSPVEQWPGSPCYGILSRPVAEVSAVDYNREPTSVSQTVRHLDHRNRERGPNTGESFSTHVPSGHVWQTQQQSYGGRSDSSFMQQHGLHAQVGPQAATTNKTISSTYYANRPYRVPTELTPSLLGPGPRPPGFGAHASIPVRRVPVLSERDPRRRSIEEKDGSRRSVSTERKPRNTERRPRSPERRPRSPGRRPRTPDPRRSRSIDRRRDERRKEVLDRGDKESHRKKDDEKDIISPLNSLYEDSSVPKTGKGYGFQNFKIPKIRRDPPTVHRSRSPGPASKNEEERKNSNNRSDEASDGKISKQVPGESKDNTDRNETENSAKTENLVKTDNSMKTENLAKTENSEPSAKRTEELTQELIESFIRKSFESGEGKKLLDNAIFLENLNEKLKAKKLRKIKRILESDSEESDSDSSEKSKREIKDKPSQKKNSPIVKDKKKTRRRVLISSDSSDDNSDAEKTTKPVKEDRDEDDTEDEKPLSELSGVKLSMKEEKKPNIVDVSPKTKTKVKKKVTIDVKAENKETEKQKTEDLRNSENECVNNKNTDKKEKGDSKLTKKHKRRSPLELLQEDIREMFISEGVVTATGYRMCRLLKEIKPGMSIEEVSKTEAKRMQEEAEKECEKLSRNKGRQRGRRKILTDLSDEEDEEGEDVDEEDNYHSTQKHPKRKVGQRKKCENEKRRQEQSKNDTKVVIRKSDSSKGGERDCKKSVKNKAEDLLSEFTGSIKDLRKLARKGCSYHEKQFCSKKKNDEEEEEEEEVISASDKESILSEKSVTTEKSWEYVETQESFMFTRQHSKQKMKFVDKKIDLVIRKLTEKICSEDTQEQGISLDIIKELTEKSNREMPKDQDVSKDVTTKEAEKSKKETLHKKNISVDVVTETVETSNKETLCHQNISVKSDVEVTEKSVKEIPQEQDICMADLTEVVEKSSKETLPQQAISVNAVEDVTEESSIDAHEEQGVSVATIKDLTNESIKETQQEQDVSTTITKELTEKINERMPQEQDVSEASVKNTCAINGETESKFEECEKENTGGTSEMQEIELPVSKKPVPPKKGKKKKASAWQMGIIKKKPVHKNKTDRSDLNKSPVTTPFVGSVEQIKLGDSEKEQTTATKLKHSEGQPETDFTKENLSNVRPKKFQPENSRIKDDQFSTNGGDNTANECSSDDVPLDMKQKPLESLQDVYEGKSGIIFVDKTYAFDGSLKYHCKLCSYFGKGITVHYKSQHPDSEVFISRLNPTEAATAIHSAQNYNSDSNIQSRTDKHKKQIFRCRMCDLTTSHKNYFYEHVTTHTGEYRYKCDVCQHATSHRQNFKNHFLTHHPGFDIKSTILHSPNPNDQIVSGFMCTACHFVQVEKKNVEKHVNIHADSDFGNSELPKVLTVNMSKEDPVEKNETSENSILLSQSVCKDDSANHNLEAPEFAKTVELCEAAIEPHKESKDDKTDDVNSNVLCEQVKKDVNNIPDTAGEKISKTTVCVSENVPDDLQNLKQGKEDFGSLASTLAHSEVTSAPVKSFSKLMKSDVAVSDSKENCEVSEVPSDISHSGNCKETQKPIQKEDGVRTPSEDLAAMNLSTSLSKDHSEGNALTASNEAVSNSQMLSPNSPIVINEVVHTKSQVQQNEDSEHKLEHKVHMKSPIQQNEDHEHKLEHKVHTKSQVEQNCDSEQKLERKINTKLQIQQDGDPQQKLEHPIKSIIDDSEENRKRIISAFIPSDTADTHEEKLQNERFKTMEAITQSLKLKPVIKSKIDSLIESIDSRKKQEEAKNPAVDTACAADISDINTVGSISGKSDESTIIDEKRAVEAAQAVQCSDTLSIEPVTMMSSSKSKDDPYSEQESIDDDVIKCSDSSLFDKIFSPALNKIQKKENKLKQPVMKTVTISNSENSAVDSVEIEPLTKDKIRNLSECSFEDEHENSLPLIVQKLAKCISDPSGILSDEEPVETENSDVVAEKDDTADSSDVDSVCYDDLRDEVATYEKRIMALSGCHNSDLGQTASAKDNLQSEVSNSSNSSKKTGYVPPPPLAIRMGKKIISEITFGTPDIRVGSFSARLYGSSKVLFSCLIQGCIFQCTHVPNFSEHLRLNHKNSYWNGFCQTCKKNIKGEGSKSSHVPHAIAFSHLLDEHVSTDVSYESDSLEKPDSLEPQQEESQDSCSSSDEKDTDSSEDNNDLSSSAQSENLKTAEKQFILQKSDAVIADHSYNKHREPDDILKETLDAIRRPKDSETDLKLPDENENSGDTRPNTESTEKSDTCNEKPRVYLRTRRLSGDKLSGHKDESTIPASVPDVEPVTAEEESSGSDGVPFLKIGAVVSLNPNAENSVGAIEELDVIDNEILLDKDNSETVSNDLVEISPQTQEIETSKTDSVTSGEKREKEHPLVNAVIVSPITPVSSDQTPMLQVIPGVRICSMNNKTVTVQPAQSGTIQTQQSPVWPGTTATNAVATTSSPPGRFVRILPRGSSSVLNSSPPPTHQVLPNSGAEMPSESSQSVEETPLRSDILNEDISSSSEWLPRDKNIKVLRRMMTMPKLRNLYKCMEKNCTYTEDNDRSFIYHIGTAHYNQRNSDWNRCSYCEFRGNGKPSDLVKHVTETHGHCQYQCAYCFFRGMVCSIVVLHQNTSHISKPVKVLKCINLKSIPPSENELEPLGSVVFPYICDQGNCDTKFYNPSDFLLHLQWHHHQVTTLTCHICKAPCFKPARLIAHYRLHSYSMYQCRHCLHGAETEEEIQQHLCNSHHNLRALAVLRHFDPAKKNLSGDIHRLKIVNLDQTVSDDVIIQPSEMLQLCRGTESNQTSVDWTEDDLSEIQDSAQTVRSEIRENEVSDVPTPVFEIVPTELVGNVNDNAVSQSAENISFRIVTNEGNKSVCEAVLNKITDEKEISQKELTGNVWSKNDSTITEMSTSEKNAQENFAGEVEGASKSPLKKNDNDNEDDDVQVVYQLTTQRKLCNHSVCKGHCKFRKLYTVKGSPKMKICASSESSKATENQNLLDAAKLSSESGQEVTGREKSKPAIELNVHDPAQSSPRTGKDSTSSSASLIGISSNFDPESENSSNTVTSSCLEMDLKTQGEKEQTSPILESSTVSEEGEQRKHYMKSGLTGEDLYLCGNARCEYRAATGSQLREHLFVCDMSREGILKCPHCARPFKAVNSLVDHLRIHGVPRYSCSLCKYRATAPTTVAKHLKQAHKVSYTETVPVDRFLNNPETDMFVVCPKPKGKHKRSLSGPVTKTVYRPEEIHLLPMSAILKDPIECSVCAFKTKVRSNMKRHLGLHLDPAVDPADIPTVEVVNPVPCLERNEKMFDKMTNLAASSNLVSQKQAIAAVTTAVSTVTTGTSSEGAISQQHQKLVPHYVEEHRRYVCSAEGCNYLTCSEAMLRHHLRALHPDDAVYRCPHCPANAPEVPLDRVGAHLRMHGGRLYGCAHCPYHHFQRHIVERHLSDRHPEKRAFVVVIRENEAAQAELPPAAPSDPLTPTHVWLCGLCDLQCPSRNEVLDHVSSIHGTKSQFKCSHCAFRTSSRLSFEPHFASRHPGEGARIVDVYRRIEVGSVNVNSAVTPTETNFDTRPLWSRNSAGVRHIRGILIAEEEKIEEDVIEISNTVRKLSSPIKKEVTESTSQRVSTGIQSKKEIKREIENENETKQPEEQKDTVGAYGPYGKPAAGNLFVCTLCERYKTKFRSDMRDHLYRELNYSKWVCTHCRLMSCSRHHLQKHSAKMHDKDRKPEAIAALPPDKEIEDWVDKVLSTQYSLMKQGVETVAYQPQKKQAAGIKRSHSETQLQDKVETAAASPSSGPHDEERAVSQPTKRAAALLARALSQTSMLELSEPLLSGSPVTSPVDSEAEESSLEKKQASASSSENKKKQTSKEPKLSCMDCGAKCVNARGLKLHIRMNHMCTSRWLCGYCRFGGSSEQAIKQHCQLRHRGMPESIKSNEEAASVKLDDEFWETNYGLPPKNTNATCTSPSLSISSTDQQAETSFDDGDTQAELPELMTAEEARRCSHCTYTCRSPSDLRKHEMRHWVQKPFKCGHCSFEAIREYEVKKHSEKVHPQQPINVKHKEVPLQPDIKPLRIKRHYTGTATLSSNTEQESEDNEEQPPPLASSSVVANASESDAVSSDEAPAPKKTKIFRCFYCPRRATSLAVIHEHWQKTHKTRAITANGITRLNLPFSYKEMAVDDILKGKKQLQSNKSNFMCIYCKRKGSQSALLKHHEVVHSDKEFGIVETTAHHYECSHCHFAAITLHTLRRHFECEHPKSEFRYIVKASKLVADESEHVIVRTEGTSVKRLGPSGVLCEAGNYICSLCGVKCESEDQFHSDHHSLHHPNVEPKYSFEANNHDSKRTKYECPRCCFISDTYDILKEHLERHIKPFKCGYCVQQYDLESKVVRHCQLSHVDCEIRVVHVRDTEMENLKKLVVQSNVSDMPHLTSPLRLDSKPADATQRQSRNVARKSTGLSSVTAKLYKFSSAGTSREISLGNSEHFSTRTEKPYSFYGRSPSPVDKNRVVAFANYGGSVIRMSLSTFSKLYNIYPKVKVRDLKKEKFGPI